MKLNEVIAIIDDGVCESSIPYFKLDFDLEVTDEYKVIERFSKNDEFSHATICSKIIRDNCPIYRVGSIKIFRSETTSIEKLNVALKWCFVNKVKLIHLSIGSVNFFDFNLLCDSIIKLNLQGAIIVAAVENNFKYTIPSMLEQVISVSSKKNWMRFSSTINHVWSPDIIVEDIELINGYKFSNSFATSLVVSSVACILLRNNSCSLNYILDSLKVIYRMPIEKTFCEITKPHLLVKHSLFITNDNEYSGLKSSPKNTVHYNSLKGLRLRKSTYLIISNSNQFYNNQCKLFMQNNIKHIKGVIYISDRSYILHSLVTKYNIPYFYQKDLKIKRNINFNPNISIKIISIVITGNFENNLNFCKLVTRRLYKKEYRIETISLLSESIIYGIEYHPNIYSIERELRLYSTTDFCDVIIVVSNTRLKMKCDLRIQITNDQEKVKNSFADKHITLNSTGLNNKEVISLSKFIENHLQNSCNIGD